MLPAKEELSKQFQAALIPVFVVLLLLAHLQKRKKPSGTSRDMFLICQPEEKLYFSTEAGTTGLELKK